MGKDRLCLRKIASHWPCTLSVCFMDGPRMSEPHSVLGKSELWGKSQYGSFTPTECVGVCECEREVVDMKCWNELTFVLLAKYACRCM